MSACRCMGPYGRERCMCVRAWIQRATTGPQHEHARVDAHDVFIQGRTHWHARRGCMHELKLSSKVYTTCMWQLDRCGRKHTR